MAGFHYAMTQDWQRPYFLNANLGHVESGEFRQINGAEAVGLALATLASTLKKYICFWLPYYTIKCYFA